MLEGAIIGGLIGLGIMAIGLAIAYGSRGSVRSAQLGGRRIDVRTAAAPDDAFARLKDLGPPYRTDDADPQRRALVLSSNPTFTSWGWLYPVFIHADGTGARIEIGIKSRFFQYGPLVGVAHRRLAAAIEAALGLPVARVAR
jgi:hypothetical protein